MLTSNFLNYDKLLQPLDRFPLSSTYGRSGKYFIAKLGMGLDRPAQMSTQNHHIAYGTTALTPSQSLSFILAVVCYTMGYLA